MKYFSIILSLIAFAPHWAVAATLSLDPASGSFGPGDTFVSTIRIDTDSPEECVNAIDVRIDFPKDLIKPIAISKGESLISLWAQEPAFSLEEGKIEIQGGIPGGYCGRIVGDPGKTNVVAKIVFAVPATQIGVEMPSESVPYDVRFAPTSAVLLNDGAGTPAQVRFVDARYIRLTQAVGSSNEWLETVRSDVFPPDDFQAQIVRNPNIYGGKFVLIFSTTDKQSGLSHYEVLEEDPVSLGMIRGKKSPALAMRASSPYLLEDQELKSRIVVRAFDHAGNRTEFVIDPSHDGEASGEQGASSAAASQAVIWSIIGLVLVVVALLLGNIVRGKRLTARDTGIDDHTSIQ